MTLIDAFRSLLASLCTPNLHRFPDAMRCLCGAVTLTRDLGYRRPPVRLRAIHGRGLLRSTLRTRLR